MLGALASVRGDPPAGSHGRTAGSSRAPGWALRGHAVALLARDGLGDVGERELTRLDATLPRRTAVPRSAAPDAELARVVDARGADERLMLAEVTAVRRDVAPVLDHGLSQLPIEQRRLLQLRLWDGFTVAEIARRLGVPQKPLSRQLAAALRLLRTRLEAEGISQRTAREVLAEVAA